MTATSLYESSFPAHLKMTATFLHESNFAAHLKISATYILLSGSLSSLSHWQQWCSHLPEFGWLQPSSPSCWRYRRPESRKQQICETVNIIWKPSRDYIHENTCTHQCYTQDFSFKIPQLNSHFFRSSYCSAPHESQILQFQVKSI